MKFIIICSIIGLVLSYQEHSDQFDSDEIYGAEKYNDVDKKVPSGYYGEDSDEIYGAKKYNDVDKKVPSGYYGEDSDEEPQSEEEFESDIEEDDYESRKYTNMEYNVVNTYNKEEKNVYDNKYGLADSDYKTKYPGYPSTQCRAPRYFHARKRGSTKASFKVFDEKTTKVAYIGCPNDEFMYILVAQNYRNEDDLSEIQNVVTLAYGTNIAVEMKCYNGRWFARSAIIDETTEVKKIACLKITSQQLETLSKHNAFNYY